MARLLLLSLEWNPSDIERHHCLVAETQDAKHYIESALAAGSHPSMSAEQRNSRKLTNILDRTVYSQAFVHLGEHAQAYAMDASLFQNIPDNTAFAGRCEDDLIHILCADLLEERRNRPYHVAAIWGRTIISIRSLNRAWNFNETLKSVSRVADALQIRAKSYCFRSSAHDENIVRAYQQ
jgi:hypothetical protein